MSRHSCDICRRLFSFENLSEKIFLNYNVLSYGRVLHLLQSIHLQGECASPNYLALEVMVSGLYGFLPKLVVLYIHMYECIGNANAKAGFYRFKDACFFHYNRATEIPSET